MAFIAATRLMGSLASACGDDPGGMMGSDTAPFAEESASCKEPQVWCSGGCIDPIAPTAEAVQERVFGRACALSTACHSGGAAPEGLTLASVDDVFASAVGKSSRQVPALSLIEPGRPEASYLIRKVRNMELTAQSSSGGPSTTMPPPPNAALCEAKIRALEAWILMGVPR